MNKFLTLLLCLCTVASLAQSGPKRNVRFQSIGKDSVRMPLNEEYFLIEDSCASIIRYAHYSFQQHKLTGAFKDVSNGSPELIISEGNYTEAGLKDGDFIVHYLNGNLQAKGTFKANKFNGRWELFYEDGKPKLTFDAVDNDIKIINAWDEGGKNVVNNGKGNYRSTIGNLYWEGKLENGKPDGKWKAMKVNDRTNTVIVSEHFKNGVFQKGDGPTGNYEDASRIILFDENELPFINAERPRMSVVPCNGTKRKRVVNAQYINGLAAYSEQIKQLVRPYLSTINLKPYDSELVFEGEVSESGRINHLTYSNPFDINIASGLERELMKLPSLEPALVDGKPTTQKIIFTFKFSSGGYSFNYRFVPIKAN